MTLRGQHDVVLVLGTPGAGKGTQAAVITETLGVPHVASGDLLRDHRRRGTDLGRQAQVYMDRGDLVPDDLVVEMVMRRLSEPDADGGVLLDGFPRTLTQAKALDHSLAERGGAVRAAVYLEVPTETLVDRLAGRRICRDCQASYHEQHNPSPAGSRCGVCNGELYLRPDDTREVVLNRVEVYLRETQPVIDHYRAQGVLRTVDGSRDIATISQEVRASVAPRGAAASV